MTLLDIEQDIYRRLDKNVTNPDVVTKARVDTFINDRYRQLLRLDGIDLRDETIIVTCYPNYPRIVIPKLASTFSSVVDTRNRVTLKERPLSWIRQQDASNPAQVRGTPYVYAVLNEAGVGSQPSPAATLEILSNGVDTRAFTIEGIVISGAQGGYAYTLHTGVLTGPTPVALPTFISLFRLTFDGPPPTANISVVLRETAPNPRNLIVHATGPAGATTGVPTQNATHGWALLLWPTPSAAIDYSVDFARPVRQLVAPTDEPALPEDFHTLLVWGGCEDECLKMDDSRAGDFAKRWADDVKALRAYLHRARGQRWIPNNRPTGWSDLGPYFPANRGGW